MLLVNIKLSVDLIFVTPFLWKKKVNCCPVLPRSIFVLKFPEFIE